MKVELKPTELQDSMGTVVTRHLGRDVNGVILESARQFRPEPPPHLRQMFEAKAAARPPVPQRTCAYHIETGAVEMPMIDAKAAATAHPTEWSLTPWPASAASK